MPNRIEFDTYVNAAGFARGLKEMEASANATNLRLQNMIRSKIANVQDRMSGMNPDSWEYVQANMRKMTLEKRLLDVQNAMYLREAKSRQSIDEKQQQEKLESNRSALEQQLADERSFGLKYEQEKAAQLAMEDAALNAQMEREAVLNQESLAEAMANGRAKAQAERQAAQLYSGKQTAIQAARMEAQIQAEEEAKIQLAIAEASKEQEAIIAAEANAQKVAANRAALDQIVIQEREAAIAEQAIQDEMMAKQAAAREAKLAADKAAWLAGQAEFRKIQEAETAAMFARFEEQRILQAKQAAENEATLLLGARGYGPGVAEGGHGNGGLGGIVRESLVIIREVASGRGIGRIGSSVTLLAQYLGALKLVVKSTATEALNLAEKESLLYTQMSRTALMARGTAEYAALESAALKQLTVATRAQTEAEIALAAAVVKVRWGLVGLVAGFVAVGFVIYEVIKHFIKLKQEEANWQNITRESTLTLEENVEIQKSVAKAIQDHADKVAELTTKEKRLGEILEEQNETLKERHQLELELARARGYSAQQITALTIKQEEENIANLKANKIALDKQVAESKAKSDSASDFSLKGLKQTRIILADTEKKAKDMLTRFQSAQNELFSDTGYQRLVSLKSQYGAGYRGVETGGMSVAEQMKIYESRNIETSGEGGMVSKTFSEYASEYESLKMRLDAFTAAIKRAEDAEKAATSGLEKDVQARDKAVQDLKKAQDKLALDKEFLPRISQLEDAKRGGGFLKNSDALVRSGNFLGSSRNGIENLTTELIKMQREANGYLRTIASNTNHGGSVHHSGT